jgi:hypothetical protein
VRDDAGARVPKRQRHGPIGPHRPHRSAGGQRRTDDIGQKQTGNGKRSQFEKFPAGPVEVDQIGSEIGEILFLRHYKPPFAGGAAVARPPRLFQIRRFTCRLFP